MRGAFSGSVRKLSYNIRIARSDYTQGQILFPSTMAAVLKALSKSNGSKHTDEEDADRKNKQRVLMLSSRGVTYR